MAELSPLMQQYMRIKNEHKDAILFYHIGDFYEVFLTMPLRLPASWT